MKQQPSLPVQETQTQYHGLRWRIVKIMVPFWVPIIIRGLIEGTQKGTIILTIPQVYLWGSAFARTCKCLLKILSRQVQEICFKPRLLFRGVGGLWGLGLRGGIRAYVPCFLPTVIPQTGGLPRQQHSERGRYPSYRHAHLAAGMWRRSSHLRRVVGMNQHT